MKQSFHLPIDIDPELKLLFPDIQVGFLTGTVSNTPFNEILWTRIEVAMQELGSQLTVEKIREWETVREAKDAYRKLGKDPNRYRVSAEAMLRRIVAGKGLYQINALVDCLNLISITTGITIGGFDLDLIQGAVTLGIGEENEPFEAINRGELNIHRLPVYRDGYGAMGSPTSDCTRTMLRIETQQFLMIVTDFFGNYPLPDILSQLSETIREFVNGNPLNSYIQNDKITSQK